MGGVRLDLRSAEDVSDGHGHDGRASPTPTSSSGWSRSVVAEIIVGVARDPQFGPYLVVGGGGILVELMKDSASLLLPVTREHVLEALDGLQCAPLLNCFRGCPQADLNAAADVVLAVAGHGREGPRRPSWSSTSTRCWSSRRARARSRPTP